MRKNNTDIKIFNTWASVWDYVIVYLFIQIKTFGCS